MLRIILRRLASLPLILIAVTLLMQALFLLMPGDPAVTLAGGENASLSDVERIRREYNLDAPFFVMYWDWLSDALRFDLGTSLVTANPIADEIMRRLPVTLSLGLAAFALAIPAGILLGLWAAANRGGSIDRLVLAVTSAGMAVPAFIVAIVLIVIFAIQLGWVPAIGFVPITESPAGWARATIMPAIALGVLPAARIARTLRASLVTSIDSEYVRTAWSKGAAPGRVMTRHALRNSLIPTVTVIGLQVDMLIGGSVVVETVFSIPGLGEYIADAATMSDLPAVQATVVFIAIGTVLANLIVDLAYTTLNPKVRVK